MAKHRKRGQGTHRDQPVSQQTRDKLHRELHGADRSKGAKGKNTRPVVSESRSPTREDLADTKAVDESVVPVKENLPGTRRVLASSAPVHVEQAQNPTYPRPSGAPAPLRVDVDML